MLEIENLAQRIPELLERAGFAKDGWDASIQEQYRGKKTSGFRIALKAEGQGHLVVDARLHPDDSAAFANSVEAQRHLSRHLPGIPHVHATDERHQMTLQDRLAGRTLAARFKGQPVGSHRDALATAGRWLNLFHRHQLSGARNFRPDFTQAWLDERLSRIEAGQWDVARKPQFIAAIRWMRANPPRGAQCRTVAGLAHGDFTLDNLVVRGKHAGSYHTEPTRMDPVGHDIVSLMVDYGIRFSGKNGSGDVLPGVDFSAFFETYDLTGPWDFTLAFLARARVLELWSQVPKRQEDRDTETQARFKGLMQLAGNLFD